MHGNADLFTERKLALPIVTPIDMRKIWFAGALNELGRIWQRSSWETNEFTFEMLKFPVRKECGKEYSSAVWGKLAERCIERGWIRCTGTANAVNAEGKGSLRRKYVWRAA